MEGNYILIRGTKVYFKEYQKSESVYLSTSLAMRPYATEDTPAQPYPLMVGPSTPMEPISETISGSNSTSSHHAKYYGTYET